VHTRRILLPSLSTRYTNVCSSGPWLAALYPDDPRRMVGWELDPAIVYLAREHFGLRELEAAGRLEVRTGDAFAGIASSSAEDSGMGESGGEDSGGGGGVMKYAGIIVDVFDENSRVLPALTSIETWRGDHRERALDQR